ncbi:ABC transporter permease subunit [Kineococcus sp. R8]|uniref:carbohydrate ABC transporter permease n=1 Tax=Kineococcus siccus TaxID=2696567 RepID=UPI0014134368|nr:sugar ABC transporter permease [Kineococcus siccus]NAZ81554.1 ABC transporter permease subunit [Kineococcus siccus]
MSSPALAEVTTTEPPAPPVPRRRTRRTAPWWFLAPALAFYLFVVIVPSVQGTAFAFTDWDGLAQVKNFVGLDQFRRILDDSAATGAIVNTLVIGVGITVVQNLVGLLLALGVHSRIKTRNLLRVLLFAPAVITSVATGYLWQNLMTTDGGLNQLLDLVGLGALRQDWLGNADIALYSVIGVIVWQFAGYSMVIFLAGLQGIPEELVEASYVDGAGPFRRFWSIVRPLLAPAFTINLMLSIIGGLKLFDQVWVMTGGGPGGATDTMSTLIYKNAFQFNDFGYGIAMALVLTLFVAVISGVQYRLLGRQGK